MMNSFEDLINSSNANADIITLSSVDANSTFSISHNHPHHKLYQPPHIDTSTFTTETNSTFNLDPPFYDTAMLSHHHHHHQYHFMPFSEGPSTHTPPTNGLVKPLSQSEPFNINSSPPHRTYNCGGKKRKRNNNDQKEAQKPRDVVHVRARRGQATDSHSLSERLRREKINEKLRSLQDLVPGCYKTMGMAVMLDVIISYVRSLQNQIEFLSMKLSAASMFYDFNSSEMDAFESMQGTSGYEAQAAQVLERMAGEGYGIGGTPLFDI